MNKVILKGNLCRDAEIKANQNGDEYAYFTIAVKRDFKNAKGEYESDFLKCIAFGNNANLVKTYFKKGSGILIEGKLRTGSYEKDGERVYTTDIAVDRIEFIDKVEKKNPYEEMGKKVEEDFDYPF
jgi:single-strand DNA-binding protein